MCVCHPWPMLKGRRLPMCAAPRATQRTKRSRNPAGLHAHCAKVVPHSPAQLMSSLRTRSPTATPLYCDEIIQYAFLIRTGVCDRVQFGALRNTKRGLANYILTDCPACQPGHHRNIHLRPRPWHQYPPTPMNTQLLPCFTIAGGCMELAGWTPWR